MGVSLFLPIADAAPCQRPSGFLRFRIGGPIRSGALRCVLPEMQAIRRGLRGQTDTREDAEALRVFAGRFTLPNMPISGQSGHSIKKKQKPWVLGVRKTSGQFAAWGGMDGGERRMINMPNQLTGDFLHCKRYRGATPSSNACHSAQHHHRLSLRYARRLHRYCRRDICET